MSELFNTSYTLSITFLLISMIIKKIARKENIEIEGITIDLIYKYLPEIEKYLPEIKYQIPELTKLCLDKNFSNKNKKYNKEGKDKPQKTCCHYSIPSEEKIKYSYPKDSLIYSGCIPVNHLHNSISSDEYPDFLNVPIGKSNKLCHQNNKAHCHNNCHNNFQTNYHSHGKNKDSNESCHHDYDDGNSDSMHYNCSHSACNKYYPIEYTKSYSDKNEYMCENNNIDSDNLGIISDSSYSLSNSYSHNKSINISDRIKKIKIQLEKLSDCEDDCKSYDCCDDSENEHCDECSNTYCNDNGDKYCDNKIHIEHIHKKKKYCHVSDEEEKCASEWDLCELKNKCTKPCRYECGEFAIDEDLCVFKEKVIKKANIIISCYKNKLLECNEHKHRLERSLEESIIRNSCLEKKLSKCHHALQCCEKEKKNIMHNAKKCEKELEILLCKYNELEKEYNNKTHELKCCKHPNKKLIEEIENLKCQLDKCLHNKNQFKKEVDELHCKLVSCKNQKKKLLLIISKLEKKVRKCEKENTKLTCLVRELKEEIYKLNNRVHLLIRQNNELKRENTDLKKQLAKTLENLKCLCEKYNALKEKCCHHKICFGHGETY